MKGSVARNSLRYLTSASLLIVPYLLPARPSRKGTVIDRSISRSTMVDGIRIGCWHWMRCMGYRGLHCIWCTMGMATSARQWRDYKTKATRSDQTDDLQIIPPGAEALWPLRAIGTHLLLGCSRRRRSSRYVRRRNMARKLTSDNDHVRKL